MDRVELATEDQVHLRVSSDGGPGDEGPGVGEALPARGVGPAVLQDQVQGRLGRVGTALIRDLGNFPEGIMFAILLGNTVGPIAEEGLTAWKARRTPEVTA